MHTDSSSTLEAREEWPQFQSQAELHQPRLFMRLPQKNKLINTF